MLTVHFDDLQVAMAMADVELFMEHYDTPPAIIGAPQDLDSQPAPTDLLRQLIDGLFAA